MVLFPLLLSLVGGCGAGGPEPAPDLRVLFIGNSLTYANDLPTLVQRLGRSDPSRPVIVATVAFGDYSLEDHWNQGGALRAITDQHWDLVVLQQGPSALPSSRSLLIDYGTRFAGEIRRTGARPAVYMVWPPLGREDEWDAVTESYAAAAEAVSGLLLPAGEALRAARAANPALPLFTEDGFHPTLAGSYGVALVIYAQAAGVSPVGLTRESGESVVPASQVAALEAAAADAIARYPAH
jgi:hypothetical protein